jgi:hypothetical protein
VRQYVVYNGYQNREGLCFRVYVRASSEAAACKLARPIFEYERDRFKRADLFAEDLVAFVAEEGEA